MTFVQPKESAPCLWLPGLTQQTYLPSFTFTKAIVTKRFRHFDDANKEYVITTQNPPYPWINYLGSENFFSLISHQGTCHCFSLDATLRRLLGSRYNNT